MCTSWHGDFHLPSAQTHRMVFAIASFTFCTHNRSSRGAARASCQRRFPHILPLFRGVHELHPTSSSIPPPVPIIKKTTPQTVPAPLPYLSASLLISPTSSPSLATQCFPRAVDAKPRCSRTWPFTCRALRARLVLLISAITVNNKAPDIQIQVSAEFTAHFHTLNRTWSTRSARRTRGTRSTRSAVSSGSTTGAVATGRAGRTSSAVGARHARSAGGTGRTGRTSSTLRTLGTLNTRATRQTSRASLSVHAVGSRRTRGARRTRGPHTTGHACGALRAGGSLRAGGAHRTIRTLLAGHAGWTHGTHRAHRAHRTGGALDRVTRGAAGPFPAGVALEALRTGLTRQTSGTRRSRGASAASSTAGANCIGAHAVRLQKHASDKPICLHKRDH